MTLQEIIRTMTKVRHDTNLYIFWRNVYRQEKRKADMDIQEYQLLKGAAIVERLYRKPL